MRCRSADGSRETSDSIAAMEAPEEVLAALEGQALKSFGNQERAEQFPGNEGYE